MYDVLHRAHHHLTAVDDVFVGCTKANLETRHAVSGTVSIHSVLRMFSISADVLSKRISGNSNQFFENLGKYVWVDFKYLLLPLGSPPSAEYQRLSARATRTKQASERSVGK
jgi:hypothetical protein